VSVISSDPVLQPCQHACADDRDRAAGGRCSSLMMVDLRGVAGRESGMAWQAACGGPVLTRHLWN